MTLDPSSQDELSGSLTASPAHGYSPPALRFCQWDHNLPNSPGIGAYPELTMNGGFAGPDIPLVFGYLWVILDSWNELVMDSLCVVLGGRHGILDESSATQVAAT